MSKQPSNLIRLENTCKDRVNKIYVANRLAINDIFTKDENSMAVYSLLTRRSFLDSDDFSFYDYNITPYVFLDGPTPVRWDPRFDLYEITNARTPRPIARFFEFIRPFKLFSRKIYTLREVTFTGLFELYRPRWSLFHKNILILKTTEFSYAYSDQHKKKINIEKIKEIYVSTKDLIQQRETKYLLPFSTLPTTKDKSGHIRTTKNFDYFCNKDINRVLRIVFPDDLEIINNHEPDRIYKDGYLVDKTEKNKKRKREESDNGTGKSKEELTQYVILNGLNSICFDPQKQLFKNPTQLNNYPNEKYPHLSGLSSNTVGDKVKTAKKLAEGACNYSGINSNTKVINGLYKINACLVEVIINKINSGYETKEDICNFLLKSNPCLGKLGLDKTSMMKQMNVMMNHLK